MVIIMMIPMDDDRRGDDSSDDGDSNNDDDINSDHYLLTFIIRFGAKIFIRSPSSIRGVFPLQTLITR